MVKRMRDMQVTTQSASKPASVARGIKDHGAWRYPGGVIQRFNRTHVNGKEYFDHKQPELPRRKQETNLFITVNTNKYALNQDRDAVDPRRWYVTSEATREAMSLLGTRDAMKQYYVFGPVHPDVYATDEFDVVIEKPVKWEATVEAGEQQFRTHAHAWMTATHYSQIQMNVPLMQKMFKDSYNAAVDRLTSDPAERQQYRITRRPFISIKQLPQSNWMEIFRGYMHKMAEGSSDTPPTQAV